MNGQLWEECEICSQEPVCATCFKCHKHCSCGKPRPALEVPIFDDEESMPHPARVHH